MGVAVVLVLAVTLVGCGWSSSAVLHRGEAGAGSSPERGAVLAIEGWSAWVSIHPRRSGPISFSVERLQPAPRTRWRSVDTTRSRADNRGDRPVTFEDTRRSAFMWLRGELRLLAADEGCGYAYDDPGSPVQAGACRLYRDLIVVQPPASERRVVTVWGRAARDEQARPGHLRVPQADALWGRSASA
jgi:hypothetical protein